MNHDWSLITKYIYYLQVVLSSPDYTYLDHPYEPHPEERGKNWATPYTDTRKIFGFAPVDLYNDINCNFSNCSQAQQNVVGKKRLCMCNCWTVYKFVLTTECCLLRWCSGDIICHLREIQELFLEKYTRAQFKLWVENVVYQSQLVGNTDFSSATFLSEQGAIS